MTAPVLANVFNQGSNRVVIFFSEPVEAATATNAGNYTIGGIVISNAVLQSDNRSVSLATSKLFSGSNYLLTVSGVRDRATTPNTIAANSQWLFRAADFYPQDIGNPALAGKLSRMETGLILPSPEPGCPLRVINFTLVTR